MSIPSPSLLALLCAPLLPAPAPLAPQESEADPVVTAYHAAHEAGNEEALANLWREHPDRILVTIDADLEGSLAAWEADPADGDTIEALEARALWGARVASRATGRGIFLDYASSFTGWGDDEKRDFRAGQGAFGAARKAMAAQDAEEALAQARRCRELAAPLGDWWGTAMGYSAEGRALLSLERPAEAAAASGQSRLLYAALGLVGSEYGELGVLAEAARRLSRWERLLALAEVGLTLGEELGDPRARERWLGLRLEAQEALGLEDAAAATREALKR